MVIAVGRSRLLAASVVAVALIVAGCSSSAPNTLAATPTSAVGAGVSGGTCGGGAAGNGNGPEASPPGDIPDNQAYVSYQPPTGGYSVKVPEGWARAEQANAAIFTDKFNSIRIERQPVAAAPTVASAQAEVAAVPAESTCYQAGKITTVSRQAGPAVLATYQADSPPNPVTAKVVHQDIERYEFWRHGTEVILTLASPQGSDNVDPWRKVTDSFTWLP